MNIIELHFSNYTLTLRKTIRVSQGDTFSSVIFDLMVLIWWFKLAWLNQARMACSPFNSHVGLAWSLLDAWYP